MTTIHLDLGARGYDINIGQGALKLAGKLFDLDRRVLIVTDGGVPKEYAEVVAACCREAKILTLPEGEKTKSIECFAKVLSEMLDFHMTRSDCVVAVGGGVIGDLGGFAAASFMRGIDFYNIPTTLLSQVDSSIGGKTAINLSGVKNIVGAFYQPKGVIIDPDTLKTLPQRQISNGLAEAIKMSLTSDKELFDLMDGEDDIEAVLEQIIVGSINIKKAVVEGDEREGGIRKILNFGHTLGHGIEAESMDRLYHGECVALGMLPMCSAKVRERLIPLLKKVGLPVEYDGDIKRALSFVTHDKKSDGGLISVIFVDEIGEYRIEKMDVSAFSAHVLGELK